MKDRLFTILFVLVGVTLFQMFKRELFPDGGTMRTVAAGAVGGVCAVLGGFVDAKRNKGGGGRS